MREVAVYMNRCRDSKGYHGTMIVFEKLKFEKNVNFQMTVIASNPVRLHAHNPGRSCDFYFCSN
jgi:hypothetical protein